MAPVDQQPVTTEHSTQIIGDNWPTTSEFDTGQAANNLFTLSTDSLGTGSTAEQMEAVVTANSTGATPAALVAGFTEDQRAAVDRAVRQLNMGQGASVMAQDILNSKVKLNGITTSFEAAVQQLRATYGTTNQEEMQKKFDELLQQAKADADEVGSNHKATQDSLVSGVQKGASPTIPDTMTPTDSSNASVPGMDPSSLGSMLQNVGGKMAKPPNLPMPDPSKMVQPVAKGAQSAIQELMKSKPGGEAGNSGVPISNDALKKLTAASGISPQNASLSAPGKDGGPGDDAERDSAAGGPGGRSLGGPGEQGGGSGRHAAPDSASDASGDESGDADGDESGKPDGSDRGGDDGRPLPPVGSDGKPLGPPPGTGPDGNPAGPPPGGPGQPDGGPSSQGSGSGEGITTVPTSATPPSEPAITGSPDSSPAATTLSSGGADTGAASLSTHTSSGEAATGGSTLASPGAAAAVGGHGAGGQGAMMGSPMMGGMGAMGAGGAGGPSGSGSRSGSGSPKTATGSGAAGRGVNDDAELTDFGSAFIGLDDATDAEMLTASILAAVVRAHSRLGWPCEVAVGLSPQGAILCTSDGLGFFAPGTLAPPPVVPLATVVGDDFAARWLGCAGPHRPLLDAERLGLVGPLEAVVCSDPDAGVDQVRVITAEQIAAVNIMPGTTAREDIDSVDEVDVPDAAVLVDATFGPRESALELADRVVSARWSGDPSPQKVAAYARVWGGYLAAAAAADIRAGDTGDARYALRCALRIPPMGGVL